MMRCVVRDSERIEKNQFGDFVWKQARVETSRSGAKTVPHKHEFVQRQVIDRPHDARHEHKVIVRESGGKGRGQTVSGEVQTDVEETGGQQRNKTVERVAVVHDAMKTENGRVSFVPPSFACEQTKRKLLVYSGISVCDTTSYQPTKVVLGLEKSKSYCPDTVEPCDTT